MSTKRMPLDHDWHESWTEVKAERDELASELEHLRLDVFNEWGHGHRSAAQCRRVLGEQTFVRLASARLADG